MTVSRVSDALIRVIYRKCRGIYPNQDDIQNISVYLIVPLGLDINVTGREH
jgi:hypothetical protein